MRARGAGSPSHIFEILNRQRVTKLEEEACALREQVTKLMHVDERLLSSKEVAPYVGVTHPKTVERWVREEGLPCVKLGRNLRFRLGDVLRWRAQRMGG